MTDPLPELLNGRYRLEETIRRGPGTETHRGRDLLLGRDVVVRVRSYGPDEVLERRRHHAIARLLAPLTHHNLIPLLDFETLESEDGSSRLVLIVEAARGRSLRNRLTTGVPLTTRQAAAVAFDLAEALEYLHEHGIVHLGLTPGVVLLTEQDEGFIRAQISDLATATRAGGPAKQRRVAPANLPYAAPEQLQGGGGAPSDVYALSLLVLESLTGRQAFRDPVLRAADPAARPEIPAGTPTGFAELLRRGTAPDPADRPTSTELAREFRRVLAAEIGRNRRLAPAIRSEDDEEARIAALHRYDLLDTPPEGAFDRITTLAARVFDMPVSTVSIVDRDRIWFKSHFGLDGGEIARDPGLCATVVSTGAAVYIPDAEADDSARRNPLIAGDLGLRSYAGIPLTSVDGYTLGALSVADYRPRTLTGEQLDTLEQLASMITHELEMRLATRRAVLSHD
jgi:serine/threonine protein kinase